MSPDLPAQSSLLAVKCEGPALAGPFSKDFFIFLYFYFIELSGTKMPNWVDLFLACK